jgi:Ca2+-binding EF-hand superfamily protein
MKFFEEADFLKMVEDSWGIKEAAHIAVTKEDIANLINAIRHSLLKSGNERHTEEFVLRELFREFARDGDGAVTTTELRAMLNKINLNAEDKYLEAFINMLDKNNNGHIEFEELKHIIVEGRYTKK